MVFTVEPAEQRRERGVVAPAAAAAAAKYWLFRIWMV